MSESGGPRYRSGLLYALVAYTWWGGVPLYFSALRNEGVSAGEILAHRIAWSLPLLLALTAAAGGWVDLFATLRDRRLVRTLFVSAVLLACNWLLYIYAAVTDRVTEASLGYFMLPLVNAALATAVLGERLRPAHYPALALTAMAVVVPAVAAGRAPVLAVGLAVTFGCYSVVRKRAPVDSLTGLTVESLLMLPPSLAYLLYLAAVGQNHLAGGGRLVGLLAFSSVVTVVPLLTFNLAIRRLPLLAVSFLQFLSPTIQLLLALYVLGQETLTDDKRAAFACVWAAVVIFVGDAAWQARGARRAKAHPLQRVGFGPLTPQSGPPASAGRRR